LLESRFGSLQVAWSASQSELATAGLDRGVVAYPPEHASLIAQIVEQGAVISEYPLGTKPEERHFPRRNRLLSGLSVATLVIEAGEGNGP
jgi:predicted Rossmann fold nucleotide-binding protein DprA/Smf involved in DNA uptake